jgi:hypothetical protein
VYYKTKAEYAILHVLHACHERRNEALKLCKLIFGARFPHPVYFDFDKDIVLMTGDNYFGGSYALRSFIKGSWAGVTKLSMLQENLRYLAIGGEELYVSDLALTQALRNWIS